MTGRAGIDLNGWHDRAARNWTISADGERQDELSLIDGGVFGAVVKAGDRWIGGAQAALAPHGRSPGWGTVGASGRRVAIRELLSANEPDDAPLVAALAAMAQGADHVCLAIDDVPRSTDLFQERLIAGLRKAGAYRHLLVWRPVLVALWAIGERLVSTGQTLGVICHDRDGFSIQTLRIRREAGRDRDVLAPERRTAGLLHPGQFGYAGLAEIAGGAVEKTVSPQVRPDRLEPARAVARLALGIPAETEMLRVVNGDWFRLVPPDPPSLPSVDLSDATREILAACDLVVFESLTSGQIQQGLRHGLEEALGRAVQPAAEAAVALGALDATERQARREPVYFDFLPQVSTIVSDAASGKARNYDLIEADATLAAGTIYRSPLPAVLGLPGGSLPIKVHLRKENEPQPRLATVDFGSNAPAGTQVELSVEQAPLSGRARILLSIPSLSRQHVVDWDAADVLGSDWQDIIERLDAPPLSIPNRLTLPCGMAGWEDSARGPGLLSLLHRNDGRSAVDWEELANRLSQRPGGTYCISSDGQLPEEVPAWAQEQLNELTKRALAEEMSRLGHRRKEDNHRLRFLTWQFRRCPPELVDALLPALSDEAGGWRRAFPHWAHWKLVYQGLGRAASSEIAERALLEIMISREPSTWQWWRENACLSFLLSRSETAPALLSRKDVERIGSAVLADFHRCLGSPYTTFFYAPFLMVGLLRWRMVTPRAFLIGSDPLARAFDDIIVQTLPDLSAAARVRPSLLRYESILNDIRDELRGIGSNPELLMDIFRQDDEGDFPS